MMPIEPVPLHEAARERYLSYALSVITSRALPDVRDGLKPVQRRILYTMFNELSLHPTGRYRKCAAVVGDVMGKFHPHGDQSIYEALVRMAQDFSLRHPLVDGQGNFGSLDGDPAAAMRYTECRLRDIAEELLTELGKRTVDFRPSYDGQRSEPIVLPAQFPQVLVNGSEGIAVGMATRIPPHNLREVCDAAIALSRDRALTGDALTAFVRGPDFPTGGRLLASPDDLRAIYATGQGTVRLRATWEVEKDGRKRQIVITSIPYGTNKSKLLERIGAEVAGKKLPQVQDARDESTEIVRIVLDLKQDASADAAMAYLFKHTPLETTWPINLTCLVPIAKEHVGEDAWDAAAPARLSLHEILSHWLDFRFETIRRRYDFDLAELRERIHVLDGLARVFDALDEAVAIIRKSASKRDAGERLMERFDLDEVQVEAILQLRLYKLAAMEREEILEELRDKTLRAEEFAQILGSNDLLWDRVRTELTAIRDAYAEPRRTIVGGPERELTYEEDAYIVKEDAYVVVSRDGWIKRQSTFSDMGKIRLREEDAIGWLVKAHTRSTLTLFTSTGTAYALRVDDVPATSGYGEPLQKLFNFADGERVVGVVSHDARHRPVLQEALPLFAAATADDEPPPPWAMALTAKGRALRFPLAPHEEVSNRSGRKFARLDVGDAVFAVWPVDGDEHACVATKRTHVLVFAVSEVPVLKAAGKGVTGIKVGTGDQVVAFEVSRSGMEGAAITTSTGKEFVVRERTFGLGKRGGKGRALLKKGTVEAWARAPVVLLGTPDPADDPTDESPPVPSTPPGGPAEA